MKDDDKTASSPTSKFKSSNKSNATFWPFWNSYKGKKSQMVINVKGSVKITAVVWNRTELRLFDLTDSELCFCLRLSFCLPVFLSVHQSLCPQQSRTKGSLTHLAVFWLVLLPLMFPNYSSLRNTLSQKPVLFQTQSGWKNTWRAHRHRCWRSAA